jgi:ankyrin repeat protein
MTRDFLVLQKGYTALMLAAEAGHKDTVSSILRSGRCDFTIKGKVSEA